MGFNIEMDCVCGEEQEVWETREKTKDGVYKLKCEEREDKKLYMNEKKKHVMCQLLLVSMSNLSTRTGQ